MTRNGLNIFAVPLAVLFGLVLLRPTNVLAHCDGMDGPVVKAAQKALTTGDINLVLIWVQKPDEAEIQKAFGQTLAVRTLGPEARELADRYFFETLVRIHQAGEGAPYTGLKPAGRDLGPAIPAADKALETRSAEPLLKLLSDAMQTGVRKHFNGMLAKTGFNKDNVEEGRGYVKEYVEFVHYVELMYEAAMNPVSGHFAESE
jgi:uncharacterized protein DUF6448